MSEQIVGGQMQRAYNHGIHPSLLHFVRDEPQVQTFREDPASLSAVPLIHDIASGNVVPHEVIVRHESELVVNLEQHLFSEVRVLRCDTSRRVCWTARGTLNAVKELETLVNFACESLNIRG